MYHEAAPAVGSPRRTCTSNSPITVCAGDKAMSMALPYIISA